jgi:hypothetical protein
VPGVHRPVATQALKLVSYLRNASLRHLSYVRSPGTGDDARWKEPTERRASQTPRFSRYLCLRAAITGTEWRNMTSMTLLTPTVARSRSSPGSGALGMRYDVVGVERLFLFSPRPVSPPPCVLLFSLVIYVLSFGITIVACTPFYIKPHITLRTLSALRECTVSHVVLAQYPGAVGNVGVFPRIFPFDVSTFSRSRADEVDLQVQ